MTLDFSKITRADIDYFAKHGFQIEVFESLDFVRVCDPDSVKVDIFKSGYVGFDGFIFAPFLVVINELLVKLTV
jgi:hypothetical protein